MKENPRQEQFEIIGMGVFLSLIMFIASFLIRHLYPKLLDIDAKWIILASSPVVIALILAGVIKGFKGGGFEFEFELKSHVSDFSNLYQKVNIERTVVARKDTLNNLNNISKETDTLEFIINSKGNYDENAIEEYLRQLKKVNYLLVLDNFGHFKFVIDFSRLKSTFFTNNENDFFRYFTVYLNHENQSQHFPSSFYAIYDTANENDSIREVYNKAVNTSSKIIPVINSKRKFIGIIEKENLYRTIAEIAIKESSRKNKS